jgi:TRAP transporter 4TM/12TM fusion protein
LVRTSRRDGAGPGAMTNTSEAPPTTDEVVGEYAHQRRPPGRHGWAIFGIALAFAIFQLYNAALSPLSSLVLRSMHVAFLLLLAFAVYPARKHAPRDRVPWNNWLLGAVAFALGFYHWVFEADIILRSGEPNTADLIVGSVAVILVFEAARRVMGWGLPLICGVFLLYGMFGQYLPGDLAHRGYGFDQIINQLYLGTEGIYGTAILVSATYIFLFIIFGSLLEQAGMIQLFNDVSLGLVGHHRGGPGKVSVISSAMLGTINGSGVANVVMGGQFTIGLMKRFGYKPEFAGAVEATSSMGGQIMPPVMGAVAFIMAETIDVPYLEVAKAAAIPAALYFTSVFWMVHLEAGRLGLYGLSREECPSVRAALRGQWPLMIPLIVLIYLLLTGYTPMFAGLLGLAVTAFLLLGQPLAERFGILPLRIIFWVGLGVAAAGLFQFGIIPVIALIVALVLANLIARGGRSTLHTMMWGLIEGALGSVSVGVACAIVGVIVAVLTLTGLASSLATGIVDLAGGSLFLGLVLTMFASLILGMGVPTIPNYIITSSVAAPALLQMGVPLLVSHLFVFYFGIMADLTPPVALAAFAAAAIAKAPAMRIAMMCVRVALAGFIIPYLMVYDPALALQSTNWLAILYITTKALIAIGLWGAAAVGYVNAPLNWPQRILAAAAAGSLVAALPVTDEVGFALAVAFLFWQWRSARAKPA